MILTVVLLLVALGIIVAACELFTNGIEWFGFKLNLSEGAVGSILAAVGTAMPETLIPIVAIVFGGGTEASHEIGIGAILGAPFLLSTLAMFVTGTAIIIFKHTRGRSTDLTVNTKMLDRDMIFFLVVYTLAVSASFLGEGWWKYPIIIGLVGLYLGFVLITLREESHTEAEELKRLYFCPVGRAPGLGLIVLQIIAALAIIVFGARFFVGQVESLSDMIGISALVLSLIITPIATELPEKFNSVLWVRKGKDTLALGNVTGAMVFQSSIVPAIGIALTPWVLDSHALSSAILAITSGGLIYLIGRLRGKLTAYTMLLGGLFYVIFLYVLFALPA